MLFSTMLVRCSSHTSESCGGLDVNKRAWHACMARRGGKNNTARDVLYCAAKAASQVAAVLPTHAPGRTAQPTLLHAPSGRHISTAPACFYTRWARVPVLQRMRAAGMPCRLPCPIHSPTLMRSYVVRSEALGLSCCERMLRIGPTLCVSPVSCESSRLYAQTPWRA